MSAELASSPPAALEVVEDSILDQDLSGLLSKTRPSSDTSPMHAKSIYIDECIKNFGAIGLDELNIKADMLDRIDNKYIVASDCLCRMLSLLDPSFDVLEISSKRAFTYSTRYFDDEDRRGYYDHHQQRRKRCKARVREYVDAGFSYFEVKTNEQRSTTLKRRLTIAEPLKKLDERCLDFVKNCFRESYNNEFTKSLQSVILIKYRRITLIAKEGGERLTIDTDICFETDSIEYVVPPDIFIIETKSARGNGIADKILRAMHVQPTKRVSKYCIGMVVTKQVDKYNGFLPALRRFGIINRMSAMGRSV